MSQQDSDPSKWSWKIWRRENVYPALLSAGLSLMIALATAACFMLAVGGGVLAPDRNAPAEPAPPPVVKVVAGDDTDIDEQPFGATGWISRPDVADSYADNLPFGSFRETPAFKAARGDDPEDVFLWEHGRKVLGHLIPTENQGSVGSCVSFGTNMAIQTSICVLIAEGSANTEYKDLVEEVTYGGSRVEIGGGKIRGDGSIGAWAARFVKEYGVVARGKYGDYDLSSYSESRARKYGKDGVPDQIEQIAREFPVKEVTRCGSWEEVKRAIQNGYPIAVCSDQGFNRQRDKDGFSRPQGTWHHCMCILGVKGGNRAAGYILNSWGKNWINGPVGVGNPPPGGFWADARVIDRMARQGDTWAFSGFEGFPRQELDWFAIGNRDRDPLRRLTRPQVVGRLTDIAPYTLAP